MIPKHKKETETDRLAFPKQKIIDNGILTSKSV